MRRSCVRLTSTPGLRSRSRGSAPSPRRTASRCTTAPTARRSRLGAKQGRGRPVAAQAQAVVEAVERCRSVRQWGEPAMPRRNRSGRRVPHALPHTLPHALASRRAVCCCIAARLFRRQSRSCSPSSTAWRSRRARTMARATRACPASTTFTRFGFFFFHSHARAHTLALSPLRARDRPRERESGRSVASEWNLIQCALPLPPATPPPPVLPRTLRFRARSRTRFACARFPAAIRRHMACPRRSHDGGVVIRGPVRG